MSFRKMPLCLCQAGKEYLDIVVACGCGERCSSRAVVVFSIKVTRTPLLKNELFTSRFSLVDVCLDIGSRIIANAIRMNCDHVQCGTVQPSGLDGLGHPTFSAGHDKNLERSR